MCTFVVRQRSHSLKNRTIYELLHHEFRLEFRRKTAFNAVLVYAISVVYITYLAFRDAAISFETWTALIWVLTAFNSVHAMQKSFSRDAGYRHIYLYQLVAPQALMLGKLIYNILFNMLVVGLTFLLVVFFIGLPEEADTDWGTIIYVLLTGAAGFSAVLTFVAAVASRTGNNPGLMAILSFPLLLPLIITQVPLTLQCIDPQLLIDQGMLAVAPALTVLAATLGYLLFPYLWRD